MKKPIQPIDYSYLPKHLQSGMNRYIEDGVLPGGFLCAVLSNNLNETVTRADPESYFFLKAIVTFLNTEAPAPCWGSPEKIDAWIADHEKWRAVTTPEPLKF